MDYARLVHAAWDEGAPPLKVFGPNHWQRSPTDTSDVTACLNNDLRARTELPQSQQVWVARGGTLPRPWPAPEVTEITAGFTYQGDGWTLGSAKATHAQPILDCLGFRLKQAERSSSIPAIPASTTTSPHCPAMPIFCCTGATAARRESAPRITSVQPRPGRSGRHGAKLLG